MVVAATMVGTVPCCQPNRHRGRSISLAIRITVPWPGASPSRTAVELRDAGVVKSSGWDLLSLADWHAVYPQKDGDVHAEIGVLLM